MVIFQSFLLVYQRVPLQHLSRWGQLHGIRWSVEFHALKVSFPQSRGSPDPNGIKKRITIHSRPPLTLNTPKTMAISKIYTYLGTFRRVFSFRGIGFYHLYPDLITFFYGDKPIWIWWYPVLDNTQSSDPRENDHSWQPTIHCPKPTIQQLPLEMKGPGEVWMTPSRHRTWE